MTITEKVIQYQGDGLTMVGTYYADSSASKPRPGILVFPDARGLDDFTRERARRLVEQGYAAMACDFYGNGTLFDTVEAALSSAYELVGSTDKIGARAGAAMKALSEQKGVDPTKIAALGYCMGGNVAVELARTGVDLAAAVAFHGGCVPPRYQESKRIKAKILICTGADDPFIPLGMRIAFEEDMRQAGVDFRLHLYGRVRHSFTVPDIDQLGLAASKYEPAADARSWLEMKALFSEVFG